MTPVSHLSNNCPVYALSFSSSAPQRGLILDPLCLGHVVGGDGDGRSARWLLQVVVAHIWTLVFEGALIFPVPFSRTKRGPPLPKSPPRPLMQTKSPLR